MVDTSYQQQAQQNAETLENEISGLNNFTGLTGRDYQSFWGRVREINTLFKDLNPLTRDDRIRLRSQINAICQSVKESQQEQRETMERYSHERRDAIMDRINQALGYSTGDADDLRRASEILKETMAFFKKGWEGTANFQSAFINEAFGNEGRLTKEDREECWEAYTSALDEVKNCRQALQNSDYDRASQAVSEAVWAANNDKPREAKELIKQAQQIMKDCYLHKDQRQTLRDDLDTAWDTATSHQEEKHKEWLQRQEDGIARLEEALDKAENAADRVRNNISDNESKLYGECSDNYRERVEGWISEGQDKLRDIEDSISSLNNKIADARSRLD